jgi:succinate-acetate transporter protein
MGWTIIWNAVWMNAFAVTGAAAYGCFWALVINTDEEIEIEDTWW